MFSKPVIARDAQLQRQPDSPAPGILPHGSRLACGGGLRHVRSLTGAVLARLGALPCGSREGLTSREQQLAAFGVSWATNAAYDAELAQELETARQRRHVGVATLPPAWPVLAPVSVGGGLRWSVGVLLIRAGRRLQGGQAAAPAAW